MRTLITLLFLTVLCPCVRAQGNVMTDEPLDSLYTLLGTELDSKEYVDVLLQISVRYEDQIRQYDSAFIYGERALLLARKMNDPARQLAAYHRMAYAQLQSGNRAAAENYSRKAVELARVEGTPAQLARALVNLAPLVFTIPHGGDKEAARRLFNEALTIQQSDSLTRSLLGWKINFETAKFYGKIDDPRERDRLEEALALSSGDDFRRLILYLLADLEVRSGKPTAAVNLYKRGLALEPAEPTYQLGFIYYKLANVYRSLNVVDSTYKYMDAYASVLHTSADRSRQRGVADAEARFQTREKQAEIDRLALEDELSKAQISRQQTLISGGLIVLGLLGAFLYFLLQQRRRIVAQNAVIKKSLSEKNTLLKEIHHRVKNNLQMVSSLLSLQGDFMEDDAALDAIEMGQQRVRSMAIIHQRLYLRDEVTTEVSAKDYLDQLIGELMSALNVNGLALTLDKQLEDIDLDIDRMIPLGLVANEVITNALKHAFTGRDSGRLSVRFQRAGADIRLLIADDGIGAGNSATQSASFGNLLIRTFAEQLEGTLLVKQTDGTSVELLFPAEALA